MSELPNDLRQLLAESKRALEPDPARLQAVYQRVVRAPAIPNEYDLAPSGAKAIAWSWLGAGGAALIGVVLWLGGQEVRPAPRVEVQVPRAAVSSAREEAVVPAAYVARAPAARLPTQAAIPSSDWPVAKRESRRVKRERHHSAPAPTPSPAPTSSPAPIAEPVLPAPVETSDAAPVHYETVRASTRKVDAAASLRDEVQLIARARKALDRGDWAAAQRALDEHVMAHPVGQLHVERRALLLRARCLAGDVAAARRLHAELLSLAPGSSLVRSVERTCPQLAR